MKAMILAAGKGTRVQPLTYRLPKPMIPVIGKPVMEYLIEELAKHGFNEIMINVSHQAHRIEEYFGETYHPLRHVEIHRSVYAHWMDIELEEPWMQNATSGQIFRWRVDGIGTDDAFEGSESIWREFRINLN